MNEMKILKNWKKNEIWARIENADVEKRTSLYSYVITMTYDENR